MKTISMLLALLFVQTTFAVETATHCPWMKEENSRVNPKALKPVKVIKVIPQMKSASKQ